jgi:hypothetical protein
LAAEHLDVLFLKVDVDALECVAADAGITAMPTFKYYKGSRLVGEVKGADIKKITAEVFVVLLYIQTRSFFFCFFFKRLTYVFLFVSLRTQLEKAKKT